MTRLTLLRRQTDIKLGQKLGEGGEGAIFELSTEFNYVAKIYAKQPDPQKVEKLLAMPDLLTEPLRKIAAWPLDLLINKQNAVCGLLMARVTSRKDIHELYSPKSRSIAFPEADFRFLVHVCGNIARAFHVVHQHGHVIGDINHGSVLVGPDGMVAIIDCDSFQVATKNNQVFTCDVGVPLFTAPEIQGQVLRGFRRTLNHDYFGLAVLLFHILCMGRHPFAGRYSGSGDMPIERAITEFRFAYGRNRQRLSMDRPPGTPSLSAFGSSVRELFEQAFAKAGATKGRPDDKAWVGALDDLKSSLRVCSRIESHYYTNELKSCPWCETESQTGIRLFGRRIVPSCPTGVVDLATLWNAIAAVPIPNKEPPLPSDQVWAPPSDADIPNKSLANLRRTIGIVLIAVGFFGTCVGGPKALIFLGIGLAIWPWVSAEKRATAQQAVAAAKAAYDDAVIRWRREATIDRFSIKLRQLEVAKSDLLDIPNERRRQLAQLEAKRAAHQLYCYLDKFKICEAKIHNIGVSRTAMLASFGIETAADVNPTAIMNINGFGDAYTSTLVKWRDGLERGFKFNPRAPVDPQELAVINQKLGQRELALLNQLQQGAVVLQTLRQEILSGREQLMPNLRRLWNEFKVAEARAAGL